MSVQGGVYLVRHEICELGDKRVLNGQIDTNLCERGSKRAEQQAIVLGEMVAGREVFICSTGLKRTAQTAMPFAQLLGMNDFPRYPELNERHLGQFTGLHIDDALALVQHESHITWAGGIPYVEMKEPYGCETFAEVRDRVRPKAQQFRELKEQGKVVFAFIHGDSGRFTAAEYYGWPTEAVLEEPFPNGCVWQLADDGIRQVAA